MKFQNYSQFQSNCKHFNIKEMRNENTITQKHITSNVTGKCIYFFTNLNSCIFTFMHNLSTSTNPS